MQTSLKLNKGPGYTHTKIKFCEAFPFEGLGALGMWYSYCLESELQKWEQAHRTARMGPTRDAAVLCLHPGGYALRRVLTDGVLLKVYDQNNLLIEHTLLPLSVGGENFILLELDNVVFGLKGFGAVRCRFQVNGLAKRGWVLEGKSYCAAWSDDRRGFHFETDKGRNPNASILEVLAEQDSPLSPLQSPAAVPVFPAGRVPSSNPRVVTSTPVDSAPVRTASAGTLSSHREVVHKALARVARALAVEKADKLIQWKAAHAQLARPDFLWHYLLQSFATMGRASGWRGLIGNKQNYDKLRFEVLADLAPAARALQVERTCAAAGIRMPGIKAGYILGCFVQIQSMGGPERAKRLLLEQSGREGKIQFLKALPGIGDKYSRNLMMDVYHEDFRDSIAVDVRIKALSQAWGLSFSSYEDHEAFYLSAAREAGINGWELDRLMFNFQDEFLNRMAVTPTSAAS